MRLRLLTLVLTTTLAGSALLAPPANAVPAGPAIGPLDASTPGSVSGTVTSDQPYVFVALIAGPNDTNPTRTLVTLASSNTFALETWGYGSPSVAAWACPSATFVEVDCSGRAVTAFTPTEVPLDIDWFSDPTIGPGDPDPVITVAAPAGGGVLQARQVTYQGTNPSPGFTTVTPGAPLTLDVVDSPYSTIDLQRCSTDLQHCVFHVNRAIYVMRDIQVSGPVSIAPVSTIHPLAFRVTTDMTYGYGLGVPAASASVTWHVERVSAPGVPASPEQTAEAPTLDSLGRTPELTLPTAVLTDGEYVAVGSIAVSHPDFSADPYPAKPFTTVPFTVDTTAPTLEVTANRTTIYPRINTTFRPARVTWTVTGTDEALDDIGTAYVVTPGGNYIKALTLTRTGNTATVYWTGTTSAGSTRLATGYYKLLFRDHAENLSADYGVVKIDSRELVTKVWKKTVTASNSLVDKYVGNCSILRRPAGRGWSGSLGFWANTKCSTSTTKASLVSTVHATTLLSAPDGYVSVKVATYGGAATTRPGSYAFLRYLSTSGSWNTEEVMKPQLGLHEGRRRSTSGMIFPNRKFAWGLYTGFGHRYDVKSYTVIVHYRGLG